MLKEWESFEVIQCLLEYEHVRLTVHSSKSKAGRELFQGFQAKIEAAGFQHFSAKDGPRHWAASNADECFRVYQSNLFSRQSLVGRLQRALILYDEGLQIPDPMDFFEEITRHKILQGVLPAETIYTPGQLDALMMAYISWLAGNPPEKLTTKSGLYLPAPE